MIAQLACKLLLAGAGLAGVFLVLAGADITGYGAAFGFG